jgi:hypothetical protein
VLHQELKLGLAVLALTSAEQPKTVASASAKTADGANPNIQSGQIFNLDKS